MRITDFRLSSIWTESVGAAFGPARPGGRMGPLLSSSNYAKLFGEVLTAESDTLLTLPWPRSPQGPFPESNMYWSKYAVRKLVGSPDVQRGTEAWNALIPFKRKAKLLSFKREPAGQHQPRRFAEAWFHPHGVTLIVTAWFRGEYTPSELTDAANRFLREKQAILWEGDEKAWRLGTMAGACLDKLRDEAFGPVGPGFRSAAPRVLTVVALAREPNDDPDKDIAALQTASLAAAGGEPDGMPDAADRSISLTTQGRLIFNRDKASATSGKIHTLACLHRNVTVATAQLASLLAGAEAALAALEQANNDMPPRIETYLNRLATQLERAYTGLDTYDQACVQKQARTAKDRINQLRAKLPMPPLPVSVVRWRLLACALLAAAIPAAATPKPQQQLSPPPLAKPATQPPLKLELQPAELTLGVGPPVAGRLLVIAHNPDSIPLSKAELTPLLQSGLQTTVLDKPKDLSGDLVWSVEVTATGAAVSPARLAFALTYAAKDRAAPPAVAAATATITLPTPLTAATLKPTLLPAEGTVDESTPLDATLQIDNPNRQVAHVANIRVISPAKFLCLASPDIDDPPRKNCLGPMPETEIKPGGTLAIPLRLILAKPATPGPYPLVIGFDARLDDAAPAPQLLTAAGKVNLEVRGVSDALQLVGIPSLLLLPGVLAVLTCLVVRGLFTGKPALEMKQAPILLVLAVILSFGTAFIYPYATQRFLGTRRDYLAGYDIRDVAYVWGGSMAAGLLGGIALHVGLLAWARFLAFLARNRPDPADTTLDVIEKLNRHHAGLMLTCWQRNDAAAGAPFLLQLPFGKAEVGTVWLVRRAALRQRNAPGAPGRIEHITTLLEAQPPDLGRLLAELKTGTKQNEISLDWEAEPIGPQSVPIANYRPTGGTRSLILQL